MQTYGTLESYRQGPYRLWASCSIDHRCSHFADLDIDRLIARLGPDFDAVANGDQLAASLSCSKCGRKGVEIRVGNRKSPSEAGGLKYF